MTRTFAQWLNRLWQPGKAEKELIDAFGQTFEAHAGRVVLNYLLDTYYCTVLVGREAIHLAEHSGQRSVVHDILQKLDQYREPQKYETKEPEVLTDVRANMEVRQ